MGRWMGAALAVAACVWGLLLAGCPPTGVVCGAGLTACGDTCVDLRSSSTDCGACGQACGAAEVCQEGACGCREGAVLCGGTCTDVGSDAQHCGACGQACGAEEGCDRGACRPVVQCGEARCLGATGCDGARCVCPAGLTLCGDRCVELASDVDHCGACGRACEDVQACRQGACAYDLVAACQVTTQVVGVRASGQVGPPVQLEGPGLQSLAVDRDVVLVGQTDGVVVQVKRDGLVLLRNERQTRGTSPNFILPDPPYVYVVESYAVNSLQVYRREEGGAMVPVAEVPFGARTSPQAIAKVGNTLFVPLYGGLGTVERAQAGQRVARVDVSDPANPRRDPQDIALPSGAALQPFDGVQSFAYPYAIVPFAGALYLPLTNLDVVMRDNRPVPGGPGLLARVDPATGEVRVVELDPGACLNPVDARQVGDFLAVSCMGRLHFTADGKLAGSERTAVVLLNAQDARVATWRPACPEGDGSCQPIAVTRLASLGNRLYVGDLNGGRIFVLEASEQGLRPLRGYGGSEGGPVVACPVLRDSVTGEVVSFNNVADLVVLQ